MSKHVRLWLALIVIAGLPRVLGAFLLPNTFGDAYVYIRDIGTLSAKMEGGTLALTDLYGFWLPLYQLIAAAMNVVIKNGFYSGKILAALFGVGVCLFVYALTFQITHHRRAALLAFLLVAANPVHILTSTSALTDVPHAFFVLASLYFVLNQRWIAAATFAALAGFTRVESWMLIALIPLIQFWRERQISVAAVAIMLVAPLLWFYVSWKATGNWLACFKARQQYHDWLLAQNPALAHFSTVQVMKDLALLLSGIDVAVFCGVAVATWLVARQFTEKQCAASIEAKLVLPELAFCLAFLTLLSLAYVTHQQPIIFPRYGLIVFSLGVPILAWTYFTISKVRAGCARALLIGMIAVCALNFSAQTIGAFGELHRYTAQRAAANYLRANLERNSKVRIFCDEGTVLTLSGIEPNRFLSSAETPKDPDGFLKTLSAANVEWFVIAKQPGSTLSQLFPQSEYGERIGPFESVFSSHSEFLPSHIWVYRRSSQ